MKTLLHKWEEALIKCWWCVIWLFKITFQYQTKYSEQLKKRLNAHFTFQKIISNPPHQENYKGRITYEKTQSHTYTAEFINKSKILCAWIVYKRVNCSQSISMNFIINQPLDWVTKHLQGSIFIYDKGREKKNLFSNLKICVIWICGWNFV